MKRILPVLLSLLLLCGCGAPAVPSVTETAPVPETAPLTQNQDELPYASRFDLETVIRLTDVGMDITGPKSLSVFGSHDIIYYEDRDTYDSGNPYGEGKKADRHTAEEAEAHYVVNITEPGAYRVTGKLSAGQIRVDLGEDAREDPDAVVELILDGADITCTVAPAILFLNVYECDGSWSEETARPDVDTSAAGANLILRGENTVTGAYVARIYKDKDGEKKLWKQDGAIYSYMSMNVFGPGSLLLNAANEGLDTELHLTVNGGDITILSQNDGINTNEDNVSVTTVNGGSLHIVAGLGKEGDGIDSNGYLVINGGTVVSAAKPIADSGLDSDKGSFIHGGTVIAFGAAMDWAESDSNQVTMNLQFAQHRQGPLRITREDGSDVFSFDPASDPVLQAYDRGYQGMVISCPAFQVGDTYQVFVGDTQMMYSSTDVMRGPGGFGGQQPPAGFEPPEGFGGNGSGFPEGWKPADGARPEGNMPPGGSEGADWPEPPGGFEGEVPNPPGSNGPSRPAGGMPPEGFSDQVPSGQGQTLFYMQDKVNFFSGLTPAE